MAAGEDANAAFILRASAGTAAGPAGAWAQTLTLATTTHAIATLPRTVEVRIMRRSFTQGWLTCNQMSPYSPIEKTEAYQEKTYFTMVALASTMILRSPTGSAARETISGLPFCSTTLRLWFTVGGFTLSPGVEPSGL